MRTGDTWARRLAAIAIVPVAALLAAGAPARASAAVHPASTSGSETYENQGSGLNASDDCLYQTGTAVKVGRPASALCLGSGDTAPVFRWTWHNNGGTWWFSAESNPSYCLAVNSSANGYLDKCNANGQVDMLWDVDYLPGSKSEFLLVSQAYDLCLGVGSSSHNVEARACSTVTHPNSYQVWKD